MWSAQSNLPSGNPVWLLISGPSGVGKTTLIEQMVGAFEPQLAPVVTATTRAKRPGEQEGKQYFFLSEADFLEREKKGEFLESIELHGRHYGTLKAEVKAKLDAKKDLIMHITWGGRNRLLELTRKDPQLSRAITSVFLIPESMDALKERLERRGRNTPEEIQKRLKIAEEELPQAKNYDYAFTSTTYERDFQQLKAIYIAQKLKVQ